MQPKKVAETEWCLQVLQSEVIVFSGFGLLESNQNSAPQFPPDIENKERTLTPSSMRLFDNSLFRNARHAFLHYDRFLNIERNNPVIRSFYL